MGTITYIGTKRHFCYHVIDEKCHPVFVFKANSINNIMHVYNDILVLNSVFQTFIYFPQFLSHHKRHIKNHIILCIIHTHSKIISQLFATYILCFPRLGIQKRKAEGNKRIFSVPRKVFLLERRYLFYFFFILVII